MDIDLATFPAIGDRNREKYCIKCRSSKQSEYGWNTTFVPEIVSALTKQRQEHWCLRAIFTKIVQAVTMGHQETVQDTQMPTLSLHQISNMENNLIASVSLRISIAKAFVNYSAYW